VQQACRLQQSLKWAIVGDGGSCSGGGGGGGGGSTGTTQRVSANRRMYGMCDDDMCHRPSNNEVPVAPKLSAAGECFEADLGSIEKEKQIPRSTVTTVSQKSVILGDLCKKHN